MVSGKIAFDRDAPVMPRPLILAACALLTPLAAAALSGPAAPAPARAELSATATPWSLPAAPRQESALMRIRLEGRWENTKTDQRIELTLNDKGLSRWTVNYQGKAWSDLIGTWHASRHHLVLDNEMGTVEFAVDLTADGDLILADTDTRDPIEPLIFSRLD